MIRRDTQPAHAHAEPPSDSHAHGHAHAPAHKGDSSHDHVCWGASDPCPARHRLEVRELTISYREVCAVSRLSFATECGRSVALVGPNGAGKSTLLKALAGLLRPDHGTLFWRDRPFTGSSHEIAYLPQRGEVDWNFPITVGGMVEMGRYPNLGWWRAFSRHDREMVERALEAMDLQDLRDRQISALSGGQQQRTFIARALAQEAHVLLLDEPFTGLDRPAQETLQRLCRDLVTEGRLLIASHHHLDSVREIFDEVLLMRRRAIAFGPVATAFTPENIALAYAPGAMGGTP